MGKGGRSSAMILGEGEVTPPSIPHATLLDSLNVVTKNLLNFFFIFIFFSWCICLGILVYYKPKVYFPQDLFPWIEVTFFINMIGFEGTTWLSEIPEDSWPIAVKYIPIYLRD